MRIYFEVLLFHLRRKIFMFLPMAWRIRMLRSEGVKIGDLATAVKVAAKAGRIDAKKLLKAASSKEVLRRVATSTAEFHAHRINQRPAFILTDAIGDKAVFSGLVRLEPLTATIDAMLADTAAYAAHKAHHGTPPAA